jgi:hypothetical protein
MAFYNYQQFEAAIKQGNAKPNRFEAMITLPQSLGVGYQEAKDMNLRIQSVTMPGKNIRTTTDENTYGPTYEVAQGLTYAEEIGVTFLLQNNHFQRWIFNTWQDSIVDPSTYDISYYNEYVSTMEVFQLDENSRKTAGIKIKDIFPKTVDAIEFNMGTTNEYIQATVNFAFREWAPLEIDYESGRYVEYPEYAPSNIQALRGRSFAQSLGVDRFPLTSRPTGTNWVDSFPGREKGLFEDAGRAFNSVMNARNQVVQAQQKVMAFKNFFKGITRSKNPLGNLGIGGFGGF